MLAAHSVSFSYDVQPTLTDIDLDLPQGARRALIGPNGSGKTTLLKLLMGLLLPARGAITLQGADLRTMPRREIAKHIALVPQELNLQFGFTVQQMVMLGRTPHIHALAGPARHDRDVVTRILELTETAPLADRVVTELSGGEQQRVVIAMALAQEPEILILDEPTVHLDINHQVEILELVHKLNRESGLTVLATMHDLNLAALYFDDLVLLDRGRIVAEGKPSAVLSSERIRAVFHADVLIQPHPARVDTPQIVLVPGISDK